MVDPATHHHDPMLHPEEVEGVSPPKNPWVKWALYAAAIALLALSLWAARGEAIQGWEKLRDATPRDWALMISGLAGTILIDGFVFWALLLPFRPDKPVGRGEMVSLVAATSLLNYLPMRAGMIGRAAYLKQRHGVSYAASVAMMLFIAGITVAIFLLLLGTSVAFKSVNPAWWAALIGGLVILSEITAWTVLSGRRWVPQRLLHYFDDAHTAIDWFHHHAWRGHGLILSLYLARAVGLLLRASVLWTAARVFGAPLEPHTAIVLSIAGMFVTLATPLPQGMGIREWLYGALAAAGVAGAALPHGSTGVAIGLVERAVEALVIAAAGAPALVYVHRKALRD